MEEAKKKGGLWETNLLYREGLGEEWKPCFEDSSKAKKKKRGKVRRREDDRPVH